jgi:hypothetical protein
MSYSNQAEARKVGHLVLQGSPAQCHGFRRPYGSPLNVVSTYPVDLLDFPVGGPRIFF